MGSHESNVAPPLADDAERRAWIRAAAGLGAGAAVAVAVPLVESLKPSERARAAGAPIEVDIGDLAPGAMRVVEWRGKPVWILRRDAAMLAGLEGHRSQLADPDSVKDVPPPYARNTVRAVRPDVLVVIGICTHLGCSPTRVDAGAGDAATLGPDWKGGFVCPCHGSTFDYAGRVFRNKPAPTNLEVPPYRFTGDNRLVIGEDGTT